MYNIQGYLPDVQEGIPSIPLDVNSVCVRDLEVKLCSASPSNRLECHIAQVSACVDLGKELRGIHVSRSVESVLDTINNTTYTSLLDLQSSLRATAERLLTKHGYSSIAAVKLKMRNLYVVKGENTPLTVCVSVKVLRGGSVRYGLGVDVKGLTVCPCVQQIYAFLEDMVTSRTPSHSQRAQLSVRISSSRPVDLDLGETVTTILSAFSTPAKSFLKRSEEYSLVKKAFENPKFAEDVAREAVYGMYRVLRGKVSDDARITARVMSYESIHPFNLYVKINHSVGELDKIFSKSTGVD